MENIINYTTMTAFGVAFMSLVIGVFFEAGLSGRSGTGMILRAGIATALLTATYLLFGMWAYTGVFMAYTIKAVFFSKL